MIAIYAVKPDMGTKIAAALFGIPLENGVVVTFSQLEKYERQIKAQRTKNGYFKIRYQGQEAYVTWGYGHMCTLKELPDIDIRYQNWKNILFIIQKNLYSTVIHISPMITLDFFRCCLH